MTESNSSTLSTSSLQTLVLGGGCFWCTEAVFKEVKGVVDVESGYSNGQASQPSYEAVCTGRTGCVEVIKLTYDSAQVSTRQLLEIFFLIHDPTTLNRQGNDVGSQYRSGVYFTDETQASAAREVIAEWERETGLKGQVVTEVLSLSDYWPAEEYHQDFFERNPNQGYCVAVAGPKVAKFRKTFRELAKS
ncbi:peptide-methionine (S)-S-oxide reductase MsrA [Hydrogenophaga sp. 5NK40-0174]|uniref:peptide-methionine (S)-S-oxide reductase MsrA n=1 Tax=Hydrogenophaga sp. 5NK40-0174 TaxID=3127649 RepID=UPI003101E5BC